MNEYRDLSFINSQKIKESKLTVQGHGEKIESLITQQTSVINQKLNIGEFETFDVWVKEQVDQIKKKSENNSNHFAMVENFIEKYLPLQIQSQISVTLQACLPF